MATPPPDVSHAGSDDPWLEVVATPQYWSVGEVAKLLGVPVSTLRSWDHRYGVGPRARQRGRHRRYDAHDVADVRRFAALLEHGLSAAASWRATEITRDLLGRHPLEHLVAAGHEHDHTQLTAAPTLVAAAAALDYDTFAAVAHAVLDRGPVEDVWASVITPAADVISALCRRGVVGAEAEHLADDALTYTLRALIFAAGQTPAAVTTGTTTAGSLPPGHGKVPAAVGVAVLASLDNQLLPVLALQLALARRRVECIQLGGKVPIETLANVAGRVTANWYFIWDNSTPHDPPTEHQHNQHERREQQKWYEQQERHEQTADQPGGRPHGQPRDPRLILHSVAPHRPPGLFVLGGSGWGNLPPYQGHVRVTRVHNLAAAVTVVPACA